AKTCDAKFENIKLKHQTSSDCKKKNGKILSSMIKTLKGPNTWLIVRKNYNKTKARAAWGIRS
uniref:Uncharacterized protein n=1 Tax=Onchocerca volvulus TaxID=6282 RepID=A0A8R1TMK2_ONCVO